MADKNEHTTQPSEDEVSLPLPSDHDHGAGGPDNAFVNSEGDQHDSDSKASKSDDE